MLLQDTMIERLRQICQQDECLTAAMLYGSFARKEADEFSDIDTVLFFKDESLPEIDQLTWVSQIVPVELYYHNEFGNGVAIFNNLVRAEFHFDRASDMHKIETWRGNAWFSSLADVVLVDKTGQLTKHLQPLMGPPVPHNTAPDIHLLCNSLLNWCLFGTNVLARGELARALEILNLVHDYLLRMARLVEGTTERWISPTKALEQEISSTAYRRYQACTASLERKALWSAYLSAWLWGNELLTILAERHSVALPIVLMDKLSRRIQQQSA
jgi:lincosamide nucleotidyltransferase B/F